MSTITPHYRNIQQLLQSQSFSIDEYQREYKWEKKNIDELLDDLTGKFLSCYREGDETKKVSGYEDYFLGSIIVSKRGGKNFLIDGQQRITSLTLLLIHLYHEAEEQSLSVSRSIAPLIYSDNLGEPSFNLDIPERLPVIGALFRGDAFNPDGQEESVQTMYARYGDIRERGLAEDLGAALPHFIYWLLTKVGLIEIATDNDNYAYAIFEAMNDRGKPLSGVDMLKAYLLAPIEDPVLRSTANAAWKKEVFDLISWGGEHEPERDASCVKAWFRAQYAETVRERKAGSTDRDWELIGSVFHRWARDNRSRLGLGAQAGNMALMSRDFPYFSKAYQLILEASRSYTAGLEAVFYNAHNEFTWQATVLLAPLCVTDNAEIMRQKIAVTATYLDIWLMRRVVNYIRVGYSTTAYAMFLLSRDIRRKSLTDLVEILTQKLQNDDVTFDGSPSRGRKGIEDLGLNQFSRRYVFHLLARLTAYTEVHGGKPDLFDRYVDRGGRNGFDIEHIWANNYSRYTSDFASEHEFQDWRNGVAGLLLLPADVNRSFQDKPFEDKAPHYAKQNLFAASLTASAYEHQPRFAAFLDQSGLPFRAYERFGREEHRERRDLVRALVHRVWSPDRLKAALV